jgi:hypothetical protein
MRRTGVPLKQIAAKFGLHRGSLVRILPGCGAELDALTKSRGNGRLCPEVEAVIRARRAEGVGWMTIGDEIGWSISAASRYETLLGLPSNQNQPIEVTNRDKEVLELRRQGMGFRTISKHARVPVATARRICIRHGVHLVPEFAVAA